jgi:undecaprenol kinase
MRHAVTPHFGARRPCWPDCREARESNACCPGYRHGPILDGRYAQQIMKNQSFPKRLRFALLGIRVAILDEASFQTQLLLAFAAAVVFALLRPPLVWVALCVLSAGLVLALELVNTALERLADRLHPENHIAIQTAKDCAAGAVLLASTTALVIAILTLAVSLGWLKS